MTELRAAPKPLEVLYNDFAVPSQVRIVGVGWGRVMCGWGCCVAGGRVGRFQAGHELGGAGSETLQARLLPGSHMHTPPQPPLPKLAAPPPRHCRTGPCAWRWCIWPTLGTGRTCASCGTWRSRRRVAAGLPAGARIGWLLDC